LTAEGEGEEKNSCIKQEARKDHEERHPEIKFSKGGVSEKSKSGYASKNPGRSP